MATGRPIASAYMARVALPGRRPPIGAEWPPLEERWGGFRLDSRAERAFAEASGIRAPVADILLPHVFGFRLQMALLTRRDYPLPIWKALQVRNRFSCAASLARDVAFDLKARVDGHRAVANGVEIDVRTRLVQGAALRWEGLTTYLYRGVGAAEAARSPASPELGDARPVADFTIAARRRWRIARMTGDYNGIHQWKWYARLFGFKAAFAHPQCTIASCLDRLAPPASSAQRLELWIKGPAYYGSPARLVAGEDESGVRFGLCIGDDPRPAIVGRWSAAGKSAT